MTDEINALQLPPGLSSEQRSLLTDLARRNEADHGEKLLGLVLSGSAGRGMATVRSDLDVYVVLADTDAHGSETSRSATLDETLVAISDLEQVAPFGTYGWWFRWSFAWAPMLFDRTEGRLASALRRQATVTTDEAESILVEYVRLDGWLNYAYRALKNDRDGRSLERRLDAAESMPWLLDVIFTLEGTGTPIPQVPSMGTPPAPAFPLARRGTVSLTDGHPGRRPISDSCDFRAHRNGVRRVR